jgi:diguanylate cyclase (GGDEF)-like protein
VNEQSGMLLVAGRQIGEDLASRLEGLRCVRPADAYDGLEEMSRRDWPVIVLAADQPDFAALCRASRRLRKTARLFGLCSPADEPQMRGLLAGGLDDYFIWPPTRDDLARLRKAAGAGAAPGAPPAPAAMPVEQTIAELIGSAGTLAELKRQTAKAVAELVGGPVEWVEPGQSPSAARPLLLASVPSPGLLVPRGPLSLTAAAAAAVRAIQTCLPALLAAAQRAEELHHLAVTDHLTGAYNRRHFYRATDEILLRAQRGDFRATLLLYDIDDFKRYNDTYGHAVGDEILRDTATLMKSICRAQDIVARIGGDEFTVLFWDGDRPRVPNSRPIEAPSAMVDRFRRALRAHVFASLGPEARGTLTISGGLANFPADGRTCVELLRRADHALREAKASGKNSIHLVGVDG